MLRSFLHGLNHFLVRTSFRKNACLTAQHSPHLTGALLFPGADMQPARAPYLSQRCSVLLRWTIEDKVWGGGTEARMVATERRKHVRRKRDSGV